ncbi:hypothetical protein O9992_22775 [Vibrio lentus]|nr:hypothetical protein [Vibrio lentus]
MKGLAIKSDLWLLVNLMLLVEDAWVLPKLTQVFAGIILMIAGAETPGARIGQPATCFSRFTKRQNGRKTSLQLPITALFNCQ